MLARADSAAEWITVPDCDRRPFLTTDKTPTIPADSGFVLAQVASRSATSFHAQDHYLPREVFFGRFGFAAVFLSVGESAFSRFFPATSSSFPRRSVEAG